MRGHFEIGMAFAACVLSSALGSAVFAQTSLPLKIGGTGAALTAIRLLVEEAPQSAVLPPVSILDSLGSSGGIKALGSGMIALAVSQRPLTDAEKAAGLSELAWLATPLAMVTLAENSIDPAERDLAQLVLNPAPKWPDGSPLTVIVRPASESSVRIVEAWNPAFRTALEAARKRPDTITASTDQDNLKAVRQLRGSVTIASLLQVRSESPDLRTARIDRAGSVDELLDRRDYPLLLPIYLISKSSAGPEVRSLIAYLTGPVARARLRQLGATASP